MFSDKIASSLTSFWYYFKGYSNSNFIDNFFNPLLKSLFNTEIPYEEIALYWFIIGLLIFKIVLSLTNYIRKGVNL